MNRGLPFMAFMILFSLILASSAFAFNLNPFAESATLEKSINTNTPDFLKEKFNDKYGIIRVADHIFWIESAKLADYSLTDNTDQCLTDCWAEGKAILYQNASLFENMNFFDEDNNKLQKDFQIYLKKFKTKDKKLFNGTIIQENIPYWDKYNFEELPAGNYDWRLEGHKLISESIDWIPKSFGVNLDQWAWWDTDWTKKKELKVSTATGYAGTNYSLELNITYNNNMKSDFSDLRFVNGSENTEVGYWINDSVSSHYAQVYVRIPTNITTTNQTYYMYYGNPSASTTSSCPNAFLFCDLALADNTAQYTDVSGNPPAGASNSGWIQFSHVSNYYNLTTTANHATWVVSPLNVTSGKVQMNIDVSVHDVAATNPQLGTGLWKDASFATMSYYGNYVGYQIINATGSASTISDAVGGTISDTTMSDEYIVQLDTDMHNATNTGGEVANGISKAFYGRPGLYFFMNGGDNSMQWRNFIVRTYSDYTPLSYLGTSQSNQIGIDLNLPPEAFNSTHSLIYFNATLTPTATGNFTNVTFRAGSIIDTDTFTADVQTVYNWTQTFSDGDYSWNVTACGYDELETITCTTSGDKNFTVDTGAPSIIANITTGVVYTPDTNITLNYAISDPNLDDCWYNYNGSNNTLTCTDPVLNITIAPYQSQIIVFANDTSGNLANETIKALYVKPTISDSVISTSAQSVYLNISNIQTGNKTTAKFWYNGSAMTADSRTTSGNYTTLRYDFNTPASNTEVNVTYNFDINENMGGVYSSTTDTFAGGTNYYFNTTSYNQTITPMNFTNCSSGIIALNMTFWDENHWTRQTDEDDFEALFNIWLGGGSLYETKNFSLSNIDYAAFCLGVNDTYYVDAEISYRKDGYDARNYYLVNATMNNQTQNISLYQLNITLASKTDFLVQDLVREPQSNIYGYIQRKDLGTNSYKTVAMIKTDVDGKDFAYLRQNDALAKYRWILFNRNQTLFTSDAASLGTDSYTITLGGTSVADTFSKLDNIDRSLIYDNSSEQFIATWVDLTGSVTNNCLTVTRTLRGSEEYVCNTCDSSASGTLVCAINASQQGVYYANFKNQINPVSPIDLIIEIFDEIGVDLGKDSAAFAWLIILAFALVGLFFRSIATTLSLAAFGLILMKAIGLILINWLVVMGIVAGIGVVIYLVRDKEIL